MPITFTERLKQPGIIILDGATGTQLQSLGLPFGRAPERWNLEQPKLIKQHYQAYLDSGSEAILTNSFGGNRARLELENMGHWVPEVNLAAARLAREVAGERHFVLGSIGPTGLLMQPKGELTFDKAVTFFVEQVTALVAGGVDGFQIETMSDLQEAEAAITAAQQVRHVPIIVTMSFDKHGRTLTGVSAAEAAQRLWGMGVAAVGVNCGATLANDLRMITAMRIALPDAVLVAKPNAGLPHLDETGIVAVYDITPKAMADYARQLARQQVKLLGGCCGSTPAHIAAMKRAIRN